MNRKSSIVIGVGLAVALMVAGIWCLYDSLPMAGPGYARWSMGHHMGFGGGPMGTIMLLFWIVGLIAVGSAVAGFFSNTRSNTGGRNMTADRAMTILQERYAAGEIDKRQYEQMRQQIE